MSYLSSRLRLHFAGQFQASVSTVNNDPQHFNNKEFKPNFQLPQDEEDNGWWNPTGDNAWRLLSCAITTAFHQDGKPAGKSDPVRTWLVADADSRAPAKLVDLDPEQQLVSTIWGLQIRIADSEGRNILTGEFLPASFTDIWQRSRGGAAGDAAAAAMFQSVINKLEWGDVSASPFLAELKAASPDLLSIKFNVDSYTMDSRSARFCRGRIVGTIGPADAAEPRHFTVGRHFLSYFDAVPTFPQPSGGINNCTAVFDKAAKVLRLDLGNALPTAGPTGLFNLGQLSLAYLNSAGSWITLGVINYRTPGWYEETAGIVEIPVPDVEIRGRQGLVSLFKHLAEAPLGLQLSTGQPLRKYIGDVPSQLAIVEPANGLHVRADEFVFRMSPGSTAKAKLYASCYGVPLEEVAILAFHDPSGLQQGTADPPVGVPESGLTFPFRLTTDARGVAVLELKAGDPGNRRKYIDGQVYGVRYVLEETLHGGGINYGSPYPSPPSDFISVLVFDSYKADNPITWWGSHGGIQDILQQYENLYPVMKRFVELGRYEDVVQHLKMILVSMALPLEDPNHMPVTRDLSPAKKNAILQWLGTPGADGLPLLGTPPAPTPQITAADTGDGTGAIRAAALRQALAGGKEAAFARLVARRGHSPQ